MARIPAPIVAQERRKVHKSIREEIDRVRHLAEQQEDLYTRMDLNRLAEQLERAVFADE